MSEMPTCKTCGQPHWRFADCSEAPALAAKEREQAREAERRKVRPELSTPPGYVRVGVNKFAKATSRKPTHIEISPGVFGRAENYVALPGGKFRKVAP